MAEKKFDPSPIEPAHPMIVKLREDLREIYTHIRDKFQKEIDAAFDHVSRQIGFVVTTALPYVFKVGAKGSLKGGIIIDGQHLRGTLFDAELSRILTKLEAAPVPRVTPGTYRLYILWFEALKLRLHRDWIEPAHFRIERPGMFIYPGEEARVRWDVREPAHWFDPGTAIEAEELVLISVIDEVYPELRLSDRIAFYRDALRRPVKPEVMEPAHFRYIDPGARGAVAEELLTKIRAMLEKYR